MANVIDTPAKRARLAHRKNPHWQGVSGGRGGVSLGYRTSNRGAGAWIAKVVIDGQRLEERIGTADDDCAPSGAIGYRKAVAATLEWSQRQHEALEGRKASGAKGKGPTVRSAVDAYVQYRKKRSARDGANAESRLKGYVLSDEAFADTSLAKLRATTFEDWRGRLPVRGGSQTDSGGISPATLNRLLNDLRAALNATVEKRRHEIPASIAGEIRIGTRTVSTSSNARKQILTDAEVAKIIEVAYQVDGTGDFGNLVLMSAATGARHSQTAKILVGNVQPALQRVLVPSARKGRNASEKPPVAVPLATDVIARLASILKDRDPQEVLLQRWAYRNVGIMKWERDHRRPWGEAFETNKLWAETVKIAEAPAGTVMYALRHTSIVRGLRTGLPVRLVAALHDTSSEMIEKHYSAFIIDATEELARRAALSIANTSRDAAA